ncbi:MAG: Mg2+ transporter [Parcubacteria group bacterium GW2011_GWF2_44_8]|nr:MAG: Mg2+ transporter [Parcubacteria group bacterium GW2011_GWF2_44_8]
MTTLYPKDSAGRLMTAAVPVVSKETTVGEIESLLRSSALTFETVNYIYVINGHNELIGVVSVQELFRMKSYENLSAYTDRTLVTVRPYTDQEHVAHLALKHNLKAIPVISKDHRFLGVVPSDKILEVLNQEHTEDVLRYVSEILLTNSPLIHVRMRLPWLVLGLLGGVAAAYVVGMFEEILATELMLAAFIPAIVYMADAVGSQTQMLFVRALSVDHSLKMGAYLLRESIVNALLGLSLAVLIFIASLFFAGSMMISTILAVSIFLTVVCTVLVAILLPWFFHVRGHDPAIASGPLATVVRDILSLVIYLSVATGFLG